MPIGFTKICPKCNTPMYHAAKRCKVCEPVLRRYDIPCPRCGKMMNRKSEKMCWDCWQEVKRLEARHEFHPCKHCGASITIVDTYCSKCRKIESPDKVRRQKSKGIDFVAITDNWMYSFVGLFCGEGSALIVPTGKDTYSAKLTLGLRYDDLPVIEDIHRRLGGSISFADTGGSHAMIRWDIHRRIQVQMACELILSHAASPYKKLKEVEIVLKFCKWRESVPFAKPDWSIAAQMHNELAEIRAYKGI